MKVGCGDHEVVTGSGAEPRTTSLSQMHLGLLFSLLGNEKPRPGLRISGTNVKVQPNVQ